MDTSIAAAVRVVIGESGYAGLTVATMAAGAMTANLFPTSGTRPTDRHEAPELARKTEVELCA